MSEMIDRSASADDFVAIVERASLYQLLIAALQWQKRAPDLPWKLYDDLGIPPSQRPDFSPRIR